MKHLSVEDLEYIALGAAILGSGGGGDPYIGKLLAQNAIKTFGEVPLLDVNEIEDDQWVIPSALLGAPYVVLEKLPSGFELKSAFESLEKTINRKAHAVMPIEAGGINSCIPVYTAACLGLPLVDADGMGRAFPKACQVTFGVQGVSSTPAVCCDEKGNKVIFETVNNSWLEELARAVTVKMGLSATLSNFPMDGANLKKYAVRGTMALAKTIGESMTRAIKEGNDPVSAILEVTHGYRLFEGKLVDIAREYSSGFVKGASCFEGLHAFKGLQFKLEFQNENLIGYLNGQPLAMVPDLITVLDQETGKALTTENQKYGQRVVIIGIPCHEFWRTELGLAHVGPQYFGYDINYVPVEELITRRAG